MDQQLLEISQHFIFPGNVVEIRPITTGHINDTYLIKTEQSRSTRQQFILQRINQNVFRDPEGLMQNILLVTRHLRNKIAIQGGNPERETLNLISTPENKPYYIDPSGEYWRAYQFITGAAAYERINNPQHVYETAWAIGNFQCQLSDLPADQLKETIPNFHFTPKRYSAFLEAVQRDPAKRAKEVLAEITFLKERESDTCVLTDLIEQSQLPLRVTHNDAKLNNVMIDDQTGKAVCLLDLDTVMPGLSLYDFGDAVRSTAATAAEDCPDPSQAGISLEIFELLARGYLDAARDFITPQEAEYLAFSARLITLEQALRFLADYLNGDVYYKVDHPKHNLDRSRTQIRMVQLMEEKFEKMEEIVAKYR